MGTTNLEIANGLLQKNRLKTDAKEECYNSYMAIVLTQEDADRFTRVMNEERETNLRMSILKQLPKAVQDILDQTERAAYERGKIDTLNSLPEKETKL